MLWGLFWGEEVLKALPGKGCNQNWWYGQSSTPASFEFPGEPTPETLSHSSCPGQSQLPVGMYHIHLQVRPPSWTPNSDFPLPLTSSWMSWKHFTLQVPNGADLLLPKPELWLTVRLWSPQPFKAYKDRDPTSSFYLYDNILHMCHNVFNHSVVINIGIFHY